MLVGTTLWVGFGVLSFPLFLILYLLFFRKTVGLLDPLNWFLFSRVVPLLLVLVPALYLIGRNNYALIFILSAIFFIVTFYLVSPKARVSKVFLEKRHVKFIVTSAFVVLIIKLIVLSTAVGGLPIFNSGGSDSYIDFDSQNKIGSSFLLGVKGAELVLLACCFPLVKGRFMRFVVFLAFLLAIAMTLSSGKKASLLSVMFSISLGEYMRCLFFNNQKRFFLKKRNFALAFFSVIFWAGWVYSKTTGESLELPDLGSIAIALDFVMFQWAYPLVLFVSGDLGGFFDSYVVYKPTYFFHSILSPLGFPAFKASIGPSINEYLYGRVTGNGVNPTFIIEGYVLVGILLPLYSMLMAMVLGGVRVLVFKARSLYLRLLLFSFLLPVIYTLPADALLFMKMVFVLAFILPLLLLTKVRVSAR